MLFQQAFDHYIILLQHHRRFTASLPPVASELAVRLQKKQARRQLHKYERQCAVLMFYKAMAFFQEEDYQEAESCIQQAKTRYNAMYGDKYVAEEDLANDVPPLAQDEIDDGPVIYRAEVAACEAMLGAIYHHFDEATDALYFYQRAFEVYRNIQMHESIEMAKVCHNIGAIYDDMVRETFRNDLKIVANCMIILSFYRRS